MYSQQRLIITSNDLLFIICAGKNWQANCPFNFARKLNYDLTKIVLNETEMRETE